ncbi:hypothetical protein MGG_02354 [Pyricularia oryzae 70-15]|uniref:Uncharacterized protein n=1 Tax=Pyricularia oryzae (strain 70-15 / ATCC MYA-4617 / FGSC 8958) TaxID=242507 RepID=G4MQX9_PYRO7|nr:uncharacterized protein MGG_02354 [Pyricularia oryzae 70-15]EHA56514.1 hypothetical protein MGG_02354 [Pyricularia oryzae 70-15]
MEICEAPRRYTMQGSVTARQLLDTSSVGFAKGFVRLTHVEDGVFLGCEFGLWRVDDSQQWSMELTPTSFAAGTTLQNLYFGAAESSIDRIPLGCDTRRRPPGQILRCLRERTLISHEESVENGSTLSVLPRHIFRGHTHHLPDAVNLDGGIFLVDCMYAASNATVDFGLKTPGSGKVIRVPYEFIWRPGSDCALAMLEAADENWPRTSGIWI